MNKADIIESLLKVLSTKKEAKDAVELTFEQIKKALNNDEKVVISGFGSFNPYVAKAKKCRNPKTGAAIHISPRKKVRFHQSKDLF
jgi:integration host factor subunit alpha